MRIARSGRSEFLDGVLSKMAQAVGDFDSQLQAEDLTPEPQSESADEVIDQLISMLQRYKTGAEQPNFAAFRQRVDDLEALIPTAQPPAEAPAPEGVPII